MVDIVQSAIDDWDRDDILEACYEAGIPAAPISDPSDLVDDPQLRAAGMLTESERDDGGPFRALLTPIVGDRIQPTSERSPPRLGEHVDEVLAELGFDDDEIESLRQSGAVGD